MRLFTKTLLGSAIAAAVAVPAQAESFIDDASLTMTLRNVYFNEMGRSSSNDADRRQWAQAVIADFQSGYFMDMIGFDLSAGGAWALSDEMKGGSDSRCESELLPVDGGDVNTCDTNDLGGVHQAYAKFKAGNDDVQFHANFGKKMRAYLTYEDADDRALPAASYGFDASLDLYGLGLYAANITGYSPRTQSYFKEDLTDGNGNDIDYLRIFGAQYAFDFGLNLAGEMSQSEDYLKQRYFEASYGFDLGEDSSLELIGRYGKQDDDGDLLGKHESKFQELVVNWAQGPVGVWAGYTKVSDGEWLTESFDGDAGAWSSIASNQFDFNAEDEKTLLVGASYDFAAVGVEGLSAEIYYAKGTDAKDDTGADLGDEWERGTVISYAFGGELDGLEVTWENYTNRGRRGDSDEDANHLYVNYSFDVF